MPDLAAELQQNPTIAALPQADSNLDIERYRQLHWRCRKGHGGDC